DERFGGLITGSRAVLNRRWDDRSRYRYLFCGLCTIRTRLCKCQQRNQRAGNSNNCFLHHNASYVLLSQLLELVWLGQEPLGVFGTDQLQLFELAAGPLSSASRFSSVPSRGHEGVAGIESLGPLSLKVLSSSVRRAS